MVGRVAGACAWRSRRGDGDAGVERSAGADRARRRGSASGPDGARAGVSVCGWLEGDEVYVVLAGGDTREGGGIAPASTALGPRLRTWEAFLLCALFVSAIDNIQRKQAA